jgi:hypothetical protein
MTSRTISWFSCGAASAIATKFALERDPSTVVARCIVANEHPDNDRFAADVARWLGIEIVTLRSSRYVDCWDVWEKRRFLNSPNGALCTVEMKKKVRQDFAEPGDVNVFGFTVEEVDRAIRFEETNPDSRGWFPLVDLKLTKRHCFRILANAGIELPAMYRLGYHNANCIGCVKGGAGYWNKIRRDFPETFDRMAALEERIGASVLNGRPLLALPPSAGRHEDLDLPDCGLFCGQNEGFGALAPAPIPEAPAPGHPDPAATKEE